MAERTTKGSEFQALDPEFLAKTREELAQARLAIEQIHTDRDELEQMLDEITGKWSDLEKKESDLEQALEKVRADRNELRPAFDEITTNWSEFDSKEVDLWQHIDALRVLLGEQSYGARRDRGRAYTRVSNRAADRDRGRAVRVPSSADLVIDLLKSVGKPLHYRDIYEELKTNEFFRATGRGSLGGVDPAATLLSRFFKDPRLYRPRPGTYALVEWLDREDEQPADDHPDAADRHAPPRIRIPASRLFLTHDGFKSQLLPDHNVLGAAEQALRDAGSPIHHLDLTEKMIELGRWKPIESTPRNVVSLRLARDIRENGDRSRFRRFGRGIYGLSEWGDSE